MLREGRGKPSIPATKVQAIVHATLHEKPHGDRHAASGAEHERQHHSDHRAMPKADARRGQRPPGPTPPSRPDLVSSLRGRIPGHPHKVAIDALPGERERKSRNDPGCVAMVEIPKSAVEVNDDRALRESGSREACLG